VKNRRWTLYDRSGSALGNLVRDHAQRSSMTAAVCQIPIHDVKNRHPNLGFGQTA
jgi:hypothetical protein